MKDIRLAPGVPSHPRLQRRRPRLTPCKLLQAPLRCAGPPAAARLRKTFQLHAHSPAESSHTAATGEARAYRTVGLAAVAVATLCLQMLFRFLARECTPTLGRNGSAVSAHALPASAASAAATRGSACSSAAAASLKWLCALSSGVSPHCSRWKGHGKGRRAGP